MPANQSVFIILAAGSSSRLGRPKQFLNYQGITLIKTAVKTAYQLNPLAIIVVSGFLHDELLAELDALPVEFVRNQNWEKGMGSSIITGVNYFEKSDYRERAKNLIIMLSDQPLITSDHIQNLVNHLNITERISIAATNYRGTVGVPAAFSLDFLPQLLHLPPDKGAQVIFKNYLDRLVTVNLDEAAIDIDTEEDYLRLLKNHKQSN